MYSEKLENLIKGALADGVLEEREIKVLRRKAEEEGIDPDELQMDVEARLADMKAVSKSNKTKVEKIGNVKKCPQCGAVLTGTEAKCPECGHVLTGVVANNSWVKFSYEINKMIKEGNRDDKIRAYIRNFPIPNSAEDLFEFTFNLYTNATSSDKVAANGYKEKLIECQSKIKFLFSGDQRFEELLTRTKLNRWQRLASEDQGCILTIIFTIALFMFAALLWNVPSFFK